MLLPRAHILKVRLTINPKLIKSIYHNYGKPQQFFCATATMSALPLLLAVVSMRGILGHSEKM
jgi:hypothetical protein